MINLIVACDLKNGIGKDNQLLCKLGDDMKHFKKTTTGHVVVMGHNTYKSIGKPLPNRQNIVLSRSEPVYVGSNVFYTNNIDGILRMNMAFPSKQIFVIGGGEVYKQFLPYASKIYLTRINHTFDDVDTWFPELNYYTDWQVVDEVFYEKNEVNEYSFYISEIARK